MAVNLNQLAIVYYPDPVLRKQASEVKEVTDEVRAVAARMLELMREAPGVGLAAPQVGLSWRMFVANETGELEDDQVFINPVITVLSPRPEDGEEGCLSLPQVTAEIRRPRAVSIEATNLQGQQFTLSSDALAARVWQHENDHLDGVLIIDKMSPVDRMANRKIIRQLELDQ